MIIEFYYEQKKFRFNFIESWKTLLTGFWKLRKFENLIWTKESYLDW
jgi:hypothetical protein